MSHWYDRQTFATLPAASCSLARREIKSQSWLVLIEKLSGTLGSQILASVLQEESIGAPITRYVLIAIAGEWQWQIVLGSRFQITRTAANPFSGANLGPFDEFLQTVGQYSDAVERKVFDKVPHRLATVQEGFLREMNVEEMSGIAERLMKLTRTYEGYDLTEWDWAGRGANAERVRRTEGTDEYGCYDQEGLRVCPSKAGETSTTLPLNRIRVDIDINTLPSNTEERFTGDRIRAFFEESVVWHRQLSEDLSDQIIIKK